jgi:hypothetical protein
MKRLLTIAGATSRRIIEPVAEATASKKRASGKSVEPFGKTDAVLATKYVITATRVQTCVQPERMGARSTKTMGES